MFTDILKLNFQQIWGCRWETGYILHESWRKS